MLRKIIEIDEEKCNGCGLCVEACHEGALIMVDGKAKLVSENYCDGLGDCLPECPTGAISIVVKESAAYDEEAVKANITKNKEKPLCSGCPSVNPAILRTKTVEDDKNNINKSALTQWPCQIKLVPVNAPYLKNCSLMIAADCVAFAYADVHSLMRDKITLIGCPKLDDIDYSIKLAEILKYNNIKSITVLRMQVPCCGGLVNAVKRAVADANKIIPLSVITITVDGHIVEG